jgi:hypothetical protein
VEKWIIIPKDIIFQEHKAEFLKDYSIHFQDNNICASCKSKLDDYYKNFKEVFIMKTKNLNKEYKVADAYNGVQLEFGSNVILSNQNFTEEIGLMFLAKRKNGKKLFEKLPDDIDERLKKFTEDKVFDIFDTEGNVIGTKTLSWEGDFKGYNYDQMKYDLVVVEGKDTFVAISGQQNELTLESDSEENDQEENQENDSDTKNDEDLTLTELKEKYPDITSNSKQGFLEKLNSQN